MNDATAAEIPREPSGASGGPSPAEARLAAALESVSDGFYALDADWRYVIFNRAAEEYFGVSRDMLLGQVMWEVFPQGRGTPFERACLAARDEGRVTTFETPSRLRPDRQVELRIAPMQPGGVAVSLNDVTESRTAQTRLRLAVDAGRMAVWELDNDSGRIAHSPELNRLLGFPEEAAPTLREVIGRFPPGGVDRLRAAVAAMTSGDGRFFEAEFSYLWPDGEMRWLLLRAEFVSPEPGGSARTIGVVMDITARKQSEERLRLLAGEVDHRANNLLAVVQSAIALSSAPDVESLKATLNGRVTALARAHQLLAEGRWAGADLRSLVEDELTPHDTDDPDRLSIEGPHHDLTPAAAQAMAMVLHELATNAAKYGAFSTPAGRVAVSWHINGDGTLDLDWVETGGPPVKPPTRKGFGGRMLARALGGALRGHTKVDWAPEGVRCRLTLPAPMEQAGL